MTDDRRDGAAHGRVVHVVLPAYNEEASLGDLLDRITEVCVGASIAYDVLVVDDGSADATGQIARSRAGTQPVTVVRNEPNGGLGFTIRRGLKLIAERSAPDDVIITLDADLTQDPGYIPAMLDRLDATGADVVIASRYRKGARIDGLSPVRHLMSYGAAAIVSLVRPIAGVRDYSCGFRAYRASAIQWGFATYGDEFVSENGFACMVEIAERLRGHARFAEVPFVLHYDAKRKESAIKIWPTIMAYVRVLRTVTRDRRTPASGEMPLAVPLLIVAVAAALRLFHLATESLWNDELATAMFTMHGPIEAVRRAASDTSPPLYYIVQSLVNAVFGTSEWTLRLVPALAGVASTGLLYRIGKRLFSPATGALAAAAFAIGAMAVRYGQEARAYSLGILFVLLAVGALLEIVREPRTRAYVGFALAAAAAAYTHLFAAMAVAGIVLAVLVWPTLRRRCGWRFVAAAVAAAVAFLPWVGTLANQTNRVIAVAETGDWMLGSPTDVFAVLYDTIVAYTPWGWTNPLLASAFIGLIVYGSFASDAMSMRRAAGPGALAPTDRLAIVVGWIALVYGGGLLISALWVPIFTGRMAIFAAPALYLLAAEGVRRLWRPVAIVFCLAVLAYAASGLVHYYTVPQKAQWREATQYLMERDANDIVAYTSFVLGDVSTYAQLLGDEDGIEGQGLSRTLARDELARELEAVLGSRTEVWVVQGHVTRAEDGTTLLDEVFEDKGWSARDSVALKSVSVARYEAPAPAGSAP